MKVEKRAIPCLIQDQPHGGGGCTVRLCRLLCPHEPHTSLNPLLDRLKILKVFEHGFYMFLMLCPQMLCSQHLIHGLNAALHDLACDCPVFHHELSLLLELRFCFQPSGSLLFRST